MRIEFLSQNDPVYVQPFFEEFFRCYAREFEIQQVSSSRAMGRRARKQLFQELVCLYGLKGFVRLAGRIAAARILGLLPRNSTQSRFYTLAQLCRAFQIPYMKAGNPNSSAFLEQMRERRPDIIVSVACPYILKEALLGLPSLGCINIHHAPLPRYKGMMPTFWQMFHGEKTLGITIHRMTANLDEGPALFQGELPIEPDETLDHLIRRSKQYGAHCLAQVLRQVASGKTSHRSLDSSGGSYFTFPTFDQMREFRRRGLRVI